MKMNILDRDEISHVSLVGRLDTNGAEEIAASFAAATAAQNRCAIVDLSGVDFLASRGIGILFANGKKLMKAGHKLVLMNPVGMVRSVLKTSNVELVMPIAEDLNEAILIVTGRPNPEAEHATTSEPSSTPESASGTEATPVQKAC